jgi:hypothetical protein
MTLDQTAPLEKSPQLLDFSQSSCYTHGLQTEKIPPSANPSNAAEAGHQASASHGISPMGLCC